jgi:hypothetical protein
VARRQGEGSHRSGTPRRRPPLLFIDLLGDGVHPDVRLESQELGGPREACTRYSSSDMPPFSFQPPWDVYRPALSAWKDVVSLRVAHTDRPGNLTKITNIFRERHDIVTSLVTRRARQTELILAVRDETPATGFAPLLNLCRDLQKLDCCNNVIAEFAKFGGVISGPTAKFPFIALFPYGQAPFESFFSGHSIRRSEPLHPENTDQSAVGAVINELDRIAGSLVADPDRLFAGSPIELERIVADVYRAHGFDVRVTGGPGDHGIDAIAVFASMSLPEKFAQHLRVGIQVKRYRRDHKVEERELRDFFGAIVAEDLDRGVFVTTSSLTAAAAKYLDERRPVRDRISIVAGDDVIELLVSYCKHRRVPFWYK